MRELGAIASETEFVICLLERFTLEFTVTLLVVGTRTVNSASTDKAPIRVMIMETPISLINMEIGEPFIGVL